MGYCPERRCQLGDIGAADISGKCPRGLCYSKLQDGARTFGACCYTDGEFNSGNLIGFHTKQRPHQKPIYKTNRVILEPQGEGDEPEGMARFINANEVHPGIIVTQCPLLGAPHDGASAETLTDWKRMVVEQNVSVVVQLHPFGDNVSEGGAVQVASACEGRAQTFCEMPCVDWVGSVFTNASDPRSAGVSDVRSVSTPFGGEAAIMQYAYSIAGRHIDHFWFHKWRDFETPSAAQREQVLWMASAVREALRSGGKALVVCYSGRGRSGTFISIVLGLELDSTSELVDAIVGLRESRDSMLETPAQSRFVLDSLPHLQSSAPLWRTAAREYWLGLGGLACLVFLSASFVGRRRRSRAARLSRKAKDS